MPKAAEKKVLTDRFLKSVKAAGHGKRRIVWDATIPHLGARITDKGAVSFIVVRRRPGDRHPYRYTIGRYPAVSLAKARKAASEALGLLAEGKNPREIEAERRREAVLRRKDTLLVAIEAYVADLEARALRTWEETASSLRRDFLGQRAERAFVVERSARRWRTRWLDGDAPIWRDRPVAHITRRDVVERLDEIRRARGKHAARHARNAISRFFSWAAEAERYGVTVSPCLNIRDRTIGLSGSDLRRQRVLDDAELADVWRGVEELTAQKRRRVLARDPDADVSRVFAPIEPLTKLLLLTGARLNDIAQASWREVDWEKKMLVVPPPRFKSGVAFEVMLAPAALIILERLPRFERGFMLTLRDGTRPLGTMDKPKRELDATIAVRREREGRERMQPWVFHDLRRSVRTRLVSDLGVDHYTAERTIGHLVVGLDRVYDVGTHRDPKRDALERWAEALARIVGAETTPTAGSCSLGRS